MQYIVQSHPAITGGQNSMNRSGTGGDSGDRTSFSMNKFRTLGGSYGTARYPGYRNPGLRGVAVLRRST